MLAVLLSCASENDSLVNPPPRFETVKVRFYNLSQDFEPRTLIMENETQISNVPYSKASSYTQPPADSVVLEVKKGELSEYKSDIRFRFGRNVSYTFIGLPTPFNSPNPKPLDTVIAFSTSVAISQNPNEAYLKMFNANPDSTISYSMISGCPNGSVLSSSIFYRKVSPVSIVRSGEVPISIVKRRGIEDSLVGLFVFNFEKKGQYTIIIKNKGMSEEVVLLDELNGTTEAISSPGTIDAREAEMKILNFSSEPIEVNKMPGEVISSGLIPNFIDKYEKVSACGSIDKDTIGVYVGGSLKSKATMSIEVLEKYTIAVFDSANLKASKIVKAEPVFLTEELGNRAIIRVINGDYILPGVTVSVGAREIPNASGEDLQRGFRSGDALASRISFGDISGYKLMEPGLLPIAVFTSTEPAKLVTSARVQIEAGKKYLLVVYTNQGKQSISVIEDGTQNTAISASPEGVFVQAIHATPGKDFISLNFPGLFGNAKLNYTGSLATIVEAGETTVEFGGVQHKINATPKERVMLIASGTTNEPEVFDLTSTPIYADPSYYIRRYINASKAAQNINVKINDSTVVMPNVLYGTRSGFEKIYKEKKFSLLFDNAEDNKRLVRIDDLLLTNNKTYSLIFVGNATNGYSLVIQQEY